VRLHPRWRVVPGWRIGQAWAVTLRMINAVISPWPHGRTIEPAPIPPSGVLLQAGEAAGTGNWLSGIHGIRSRSRSSLMNWRIATAPERAWTISALCAAVAGLASVVSWSLKVLRSGHEGEVMARAGRTSSCAAETQGRSVAELVLRKSTPPVVGPIAP
jgi:hypothetical protein